MKPALHNHVSRMLTLPNATFESPRQPMLIVGDSIALGATQIDGTSVVARVERCFVDAISIAISPRPIVVDARPMRTTRTVAQELAVLLHTHRPATLFLCTGANDADIDWRRFMVSEGAVVRSRTPLDQFLRSLRDIAALCSAAGVELILSDVMSSRLESRLPYLNRLVGRDIRAWAEAAGGQASCDEVVLRYREAMSSLASELSLRVAPFGSALEGPGFAALLAPDGTHPNQAGHDALAHALAPALVQAMPRRLGEVIA